MADPLPTSGTTTASPQPPAALIWGSGALFGPAVLGLGWQVWAQPELSHRLLALGLLLTGIEQGRMAMVDLRQVAAVGQQVEDRQLTRFYKILLLAIAGQLVGFYLAAAGWLGVGAGVMMMSIIGFNLAAGLQLQPAVSPPATDDHPARTAGRAPGRRAGASASGAMVRKSGSSLDWRRFANYCLILCRGQAHSEWAAVSLNGLLGMEIQFSWDSCLGCSLSGQVYASRQLAVQ